jgi:hypothetical protein
MAQQYTSGVFVRFYLRGCSAGAPTVNGTAAFPSTGGVNQFYVDFAPNASGVISGTLYSTRDAAGTGNGEISCNGSQTNTWYGVVIYYNSRPTNEVPVHAKNTATLDITQLSPITTTPVVTAPTGDTYVLQTGRLKLRIHGNVTGTADISSKTIAGTFYATRNGLVGDGATDNTAAFNTMVTAACAAGGAPIYLPAGQWRFASKPNAIGCGLWLNGAGNGSTTNGETSIIADYTESTATNALFTWDGSYSTNLGTGGGIRNLTIYKATGKTGGTVLKCTGADDNHRCGFWTIEDVATSINGTGSWNKLLDVDGSCCTTSGSQGVRDIAIRNFWAAGATDGDSAILFKNVVNLEWNGGFTFVPIAPATGVGITVTGAGSGTSASDNVHINISKTIGNFVSDFASSVLFIGTVGGNFTATANTSSCIFVGNITGSTTNTAPCILMNIGGSTFGTVNVGTLNFTTGITAGSSAPSGRFLKGNGSVYTTSSGSASGTGSCAANQFVTTTNSDAAPTCAQPTEANLTNPMTATFGANFGGNLGPGAVAGVWGSFVPPFNVKVVRIRVELGISGAGCATQAVIRVTDGTTNLDTTTVNGTGTYDTGAISQAYAAGSALQIKQPTAASGCGTNPANAGVTVEYQQTQ